MTRVQDSVVGEVLEHGGPVGGPVLHVEEVGKLVQYEVLAMVLPADRRPDIIPGDDGHAVLPGLAQPDLLAFQNTTPPPIGWVALAR